MGMSETTTQTTASGRLLSAAERDYGRVMHDRMRAQVIRRGTGAYPLVWEDLTDQQRAEFSERANAVRDAVLADAPHQRAAVIEKAAQWVADTAERIKIRDGWLWRVDSVPIRNLKRVLAAPTDPRPVDGDAAGED